MDREKRQCAICGCEFIPKVANQKYCGVDCKRVADKRAAKRRALPVTPKQIACQGECQVKRKNAMAVEAYRRRANAETMNEGVKLRVCKQCGATFEPTNNAQKFCSIECRSLFWAHGGRVRLCKCQECGRMFKSECNEKFCSRKCREKVRNSELMTIATNKATGQKVKTLADWCREADECNLDYGTYRGLIQSGRTHEELKDLYVNNVAVGHNSTPKRPKIGYGTKIC